MNTYEISVGSDTFIAKQNYNSDTNSDNVDIFDVNEIFIGEIENITIPELGIDEEEDEDVTDFERRVGLWLLENHYNQ